MDCMWVSCWSHGGKGSSNEHICEASPLQGRGPVPRHKPAGLSTVWGAVMPCAGLKGGRREAFPASSNSVEQPAYSGAWAAAANLCAVLQSRPGSLWRMKWKHAWSIWWVGSTWKVMEKFMLRPPPNKAFAVFERHQSLPPSSPLSSVRRGALESEKAREETLSHFLTNEAKWGIL